MLLKISSVFTEEGEAMECKERSRIREVDHLKYLWQTHKWKERCEQLKNLRTYK